MKSARCNSCANCSKTIEGHDWCEYKMMCVNKDYSCTSYRRSALSSGTIAALVIALSGIAVSLLALTNVI